MGKALIQPRTHTQMESTPLGLAEDAGLSRWTVIDGGMYHPASYCLWHTALMKCASAQAKIWHRAECDMSVGLGSIWCTKYYSVSGSLSCCVFIIQMGLQSNEVQFPACVHETIVWVNLSLGAHLFLHLATFPPLLEPNQLLLDLNWVFTLMHPLHRKWQLLLMACVKSSRAQHGA